MLPYLKIPLSYSRTLLSKKILKPFLWIFIIPLLLVIIWFKNGNTLGHGESGIQFYNLETTYHGANSAWQPSGLGVSNNFYTASIPTYWFLMQLSRLGIPNFVIQAFVFWVLFFTAGASVYLLVVEFFPDTQKKYALLGALIYWFNPISTVNVWNRFLYNHMFVWALLPLSLLLFIKGIKKKDLSFAVFTSLSTFFFSYALTSPIFCILIWVVFAYTFIFHFIFDKENRLFCILYLLVTVLSFVVLNYWWIGQAYNYFFLNKDIESATKFFTLQANISIFNSLSQRLGLLVNTMRFLHGTLIFDGPLWMRLYNFPPFVLLEFTVTGLFFFILYKLRKSKEVLFLSFFTIVCFILIKGSEAPFGVIFTKFFLGSVFFQVFRNPFEKFGFLLILALTPLLAYAIKTATSLIFFPKLKKAFVLLTFLFVVLVWGFPFWTGLVFTFIEEPDNSKLTSFELKVPDYYKKANDWLNDQEGVFRFVSLPLKEEGITYAWDKPYSGIEHSAMLFDKPTISLNTTIPLFNDVVSQITKYQSSDKLLYFMPEVNAKYVLLRKDVDFKKRRMADPKNLEDKLNKMVGEGKLTEKFSSGQVIIYEIADVWQSDKIFTTPNIIISNESDMALFSELSDDLPANKFVVAKSQESLSEFPLNEVISLRAIGVFSPKEINEIQNFTDEDLLGHLFYVNRLPGSKYYYFVRIKENILQPPSSDYFGQVIYRTGILGKRAVEIYKLRKDNSDSLLISNAERDYTNYLKDLMPTLEEVLAYDTPVSDLVNKSLIYQWLLLERSSSESLDVLSDALATLKVKPHSALPDTPNGKYLIYTFDVTNSGNYMLNVKEKVLVTSKGWFLDGKKFTPGLNGDNSKIYIEKGPHELAILTEDLNFLQSYLDIPKAEFTSSDKNEWKIMLPEIPGRFKIDLDFRFKKGKAFSLYFTQDIDPAESPVLKEYVMKSEIYHEWSHWTRTFDVSPGAKEGILGIFPTKEEVCKREWWGRKICTMEDSDFDVEIVNLRLTESTLPNILLASLDGIPSYETTTKLKWEEVNPTLYSISINKNGSKPEVLVFSELFNSGWKAVYEDGSLIPDQKHLVVNTYANGWLIDKAGNYSLNIEYFPQRMLDNGKIISAIGFFASGVYLTVIVLKRKRQV